MDTTLVALLSAAALMLVLLVWLVARKPPSKRLPYTKCSSLLTAGELRFYRVLLQVIPSGII
jgi:hypothetical protein